MDLYGEILRGLSANDRLALATIVSSSGSTPVPPGAQMLIRERPAIPLGTVGGGCVEADVQEAAWTLLASGGSSVIRRFTLTEDDIESGMLCGGTIDVLIERLSTEEIPVYSALGSRRESGGDGWVLTLLGPDQTKRGKFLVSAEASGADPRELQAVIESTGPLPAPFGETLIAALGGQTILRLPLSGEGEWIVEPVVGAQDVIIFGGGHVAKYVSRGAALAGFRVTVVDDRPEYANPQRFPEAYRTLAAGFDRSWDQLRIGPSASVVIVTRGHKFDELVLERAVRTPARYIGMIGSTRKVTVTFENLVKRGIPPALLRNVRAPIGLEIGALTAEEIGISITAELIAVRRGVLASAGAMSGRVAGFFQGGV